MRRIFLFLALIIIGSPAMADMPSEQDKIHYLLNDLSTSDVTFIRNGDEHDGVWARHHLEEKWKAANQPGMTAEDFITTIASASSHSGKPYRIRLKGGKEMDAAEWLHGELAKMPHL